MFPAHRPKEETEAQRGRIICPESTKLLDSGGLIKPVCLTLNPLPLCTVATASQKDMGLVSSSAVLSAWEGLWLFFFRIGKKIEEAAFAVITLETEQGTVM